MCKTVLYHTETFVVKLLYYYNLLCYVKCSASLPPCKAVAMSLYNVNVPNVPLMHFLYVPAGDCGTAAWQWEGCYRVQGDGGNRQGSGESGSSGWCSCHTLASLWGSCHTVRGSYCTTWYAYRIFVSCYNCSRALIAPPWGYRYTCLLLLLYYIYYCKALTSMWALIT